MWEKNLKAKPKRRFVWAGVGTLLGGPAERVSAPPSSPQSPPTRLPSTAGGPSATMPAPAAAAGAGTSAFADADGGDAAANAGGDRIRLNNTIKNVLVALLQKEQLERGGCRAAIDARHARQNEPRPCGGGEKDDFLSPHTHLHQGAKPPTTTAAGKAARIGQAVPMATQALNAVSVLGPAGAMGTTTLLLIASVLAMAFTTAVHGKRRSHGTYQSDTGKHDEDTDVEPWSSEDEASPTPQRPRSTSPCSFEASEADDARDHSSESSKATHAYAASPASEPLPPSFETARPPSRVSERSEGGARGPDEAADTLDFNGRSAESQSVSMLDSFACESEQRLLLDLGWCDAQSEEECVLSADEIAAFRSSTGDAAIARFKVCPPPSVNTHVPSGLAQWLPPVPRAPPFRIAT